MNWFTLSLIIGIIFVIIGTLFILFGDNVGAIVAFAIGAGFLALDFKQATSLKGEFSGLSKEELIKKSLGVVILLVALVIFIIEVSSRIGLF